MKHDPRRLAPALAEAADRAAPADPEWLTALRRRAGDRFAALGLPTARDEEWKHTPILRILDRDLDFSSPAGPLLVPDELPALSSEAIRIVFVDGRLAGDPEDSLPLPAGVGIRSLARALREIRDGVPEWLGRCADFEERSLTALNLAGMRDGILLTLSPKAVLDRPFHLVHVTTAAAAGRGINLRHLVLAGPGSRASVVEHFVAADAGADPVVNVVTEVLVDQDAAVRYATFQEEGLRTVHLSSVNARVARDGLFRHHFVATGARAGRTETRVELAEPGAECEVGGVFLGRGEQLSDQLTYIDHAAPSGTSRQMVKGVFDGKAKGVFNGLVVVKPGADGTNAVQSSRNLVLSESAEAHARPQLDIRADDVKCAHGATVGSLDPSSLFYLRSRGIDVDHARRILIRAFASDAFQTLPAGPVRDRAEQIVTEWLEP